MDEVGVLCLHKHKTFNSEPIESLYVSLTATSLTEDKLQLLKWLAYSKVNPIKTLAEWHDFTRWVCFHHSSGSKDHEALLVPSMGTLRYHMLQSQFVIKIFSFCTLSHNVDFLNHGWKTQNDRIDTLGWPGNDKVTGTKGCGFKEARCDGTTAGCRNCHKMCRPCTIKGKCKAQYNNSHNNGGKCPRCSTPMVDSESEDSDQDETQTNEEESLQLYPHPMKITLRVNLIVMTTIMHDTWCVKLPYPIPFKAPQICLSSCHCCRFHFIQLDDPWLWQWQCSNLSNLMHQNETILYL